MAELTDRETFSILSISQLKAAISALEKLKGVDRVKFADLSSDYGEHWAAIFDDLQRHRVVKFPCQGIIEVNQNYIAPTLEFYKTLLKKEKQIKWASARAWIAIAISAISLLLSSYIFFSS